MSTIVAATIQASWKRLATADDVRHELNRYLRLARNKGADLVVLPELMGVMLVVPLAGGLRGRLVKKSAGRSGFWGRLLGALSGGAAEILGGLPAVLPRLVDEHGNALRQAYIELFGQAAREHAVYLVGGSLYLPDEEDGKVRALCGVFDRTGALLGWQPKFHLSAADAVLAVPGETLNVFETEFGRLGVLLGADVLYPELARALAYRGAVAIACPAAVTTQADWRRLRLTLVARAQENQIFLAQSFLLGDNELAPQLGATFQGRSAVVAPVELTPRTDGVLVEVGAPTAEAVVSAEWNFDALRNLWQTASMRPRAELRGPLFLDLLRFDYESGATIDERLHTIEETSPQPALPPPTVLQPEGEWPGEPAPEPPPSPEAFIAEVQREADELTATLPPEEEGELSGEPQEKE